MQLRSIHRCQLHPNPSISQPSIFPHRHSSPATHRPNLHSVPLTEHFSPLPPPQSPAQNRSPGLRFNTPPPDPPHHSDAHQTTAPFATSTPSPLPYTPHSTTLPAKHSLSPTRFSGHSPPQPPLGPLDRAFLPLPPPQSPAQNRSPRLRFNTSPPDPPHHSDAHQTTAPSATSTRSPLPYTPHSTTLPAKHSLSPTRLSGHSPPQPPLGPLDRAFLPLPPPPIASPEPISLTQIQHLPTRPSTPLRRSPDHSPIRNFDTLTPSQHTPFHHTPSQALSLTNPFLRPLTAPTSTQSPGPSISTPPSLPNSRRTTYFSHSVSVAQRPTPFRCQGGIGVLVVGGMWDGTPIGGPACSPIPPGHPIDGSPLTPDSLVVSYTLFPSDLASPLSFPPLIIIIEIKE